MNSCNQLPPGFRFCPTDEELVVDYLRKKVFEEDPSPISYIREINIYRYNPENLTQNSKFDKEKEWYFFTPRYKKYPKGFRPSRDAGDGFWKPTGSDKAIRIDGHEVGFKKSLDFYLGKHPGGKRTNWKMHEYRIDRGGSISNHHNDSESMMLDAWVLCKIYKKGHGRKNDQQDDDDPEESADQIISVGSPINNIVTAPNTADDAAFGNNPEAYYNHTQQEQSLPIIPYVNEFPPQGPLFGFNNDQFMPNQLHPNPLPGFQQEASVMVFAEPISSNLASLPPQVSDSMQNDINVDEFEDFGHLFALLDQEKEEGDDDAELLDIYGMAPDAK